MGTAPSQHTLSSVNPSWVITRRLPGGVFSRSQTLKAPRRRSVWADKYAHARRPEYADGEPGPRCPDFYRQPPIVIWPGEACPRAPAKVGTASQVYEEHHYQLPP